MAATQTYMNGFIYYFSFLFIIVSLFSLSGVFSDNHDLIVSQQYAGRYGITINQSQYSEGFAEEIGVFGSFKLKNYFSDIFSFFLFNISIYNHSTIMEYMWLIRTLFIYLPLLALGINIYYSLPTVSG